MSHAWWEYAIVAVTDTVMVIVFVLAVLSYRMRDKP